MMKKSLLILLFSFIGLSAFCQANKLNKQDSIPYHFSMKNGWAFKLNALQPFVIGEFRIQLEKRITEHSALEFLGSFYIPSLQLFYYGGRGEDFTGQYTGKSNYKIGAGFRFNTQPINPFYFELSIFYRYFEDFKLNFEDNAQPYFFNGKSNFDYKIYTQVYCVQALFGKKWERNRLFFDTYLGFSLREKYEKVILEPYSKDYKEIIYNDKKLPYSYTGVFLVDKVSLNIMPALQLGVNIGIQSK